MPGFWGRVSMMPEPLAAEKRVVVVEDATSKRVGGVAVGVSACRRSSGLGFSMGGAAESGVQRVLPGAGGP